MDEFKTKITEQIVGIGKSNIPSDEKDVLRLLYQRWQNADGKITQKAIAEALPHIGGHPKYDSRTEETTLRKIRQVVRNLRTLRWAPILADIDGYWLPNTQVEAYDYIARVEREVKARVVASFETYNAMKESLGVSSTYLDGQMKLLDIPLSGKEKSASMPGKEWKLYNVLGRGWICECPGFKYRGKCRHAESAKSRAELSQPKTGDVA